MHALLRLSTMRALAALFSLVAPFLIAVPAAAQLAADDFETANTDLWGVEFGAAAPQVATGGNPGGRLELSISSASSGLPAAMIVPGAVTHPWAGDFRALGATSFSYDRQVESGSANFGTLPFLVLGNDGGTRTDFLDDAWVFVPTGDSFQFGFSPWASFTTPIPSAELLLPAGWDAAALPNSALNGMQADLIWDAVIQDVSYVGIAMSRPFNGGAWFGNHVLSLDNFVLASTSGNLGTRYCAPAVANSTGQPARIGAAGSAAAANNDLTLRALDLPANAFGFFLTSRTQGLVVGAGGSQGNLCLGGAIGRYVGPGQILNSGAGGSFSLVLDLTQTPTPTGLVPVVGGETWNFQAWYRDAVGGNATSNFTDGVAVTFS